MRGVFYRGDDRHPHDAAVFADGFMRRDKSAKQPITRFPLGFNKAPDIVTSTAVCVSKDFYAAALFPVDTDVYNSWIYVLDLDVAKMSNTQQVQYDYVMRMAGADQIKAPDVGAALWPMFGQERSIPSVSPKDIVGAVNVYRDFHGKTILAGGTFCAWGAGYVGNPKYSGALGGVVSAAVWKVVGEKTGYGAKQLTMPTQTQGLASTAK